MYVNWGISINLPYYYKKKLNNKYNSIQFHFDNNKITDKDIEKIKFFFNNNKKLKNVFVHSSYKINIGSPFIIHKNNDCYLKMILQTRLFQYLILRI